jgi:hypothetical protein
MSRRIMCGFESGSTSQIPLIYASPTVSAVQAHTGTYSLRVDQYNQAARWTLGVTGKATVYIRLWLYWTGGYGTNLTSVFCTLYDSASVSHLVFLVDRTNLMLCVYRDTEGGTLLASCTAPTINEWHCIEIEATIADAGTCHVTIDGVADQINFHGDTRNAGTAEVWYVKLGARDTGNGSILYFYADDFAVNDTDGTVNNTWIGQGGIQAVRPNAAGTYAELAASAGVNWDCVDEVPVSDADYVSGTAVDQRDTYNCSQLVGTSTIAAVCLWIRGGNYKGPASLAPLYRIAGVDREGTVRTVDKSLTNTKNIEETSPATLSSWTVGEINGMEIGVQVED